MKLRDIFTSSKKSVFDTAMNQMIKKNARGVTPRAVVKVKECSVVKVPARAVVKSYLGSRVARRFLGLNCPEHHL